MTTFLSFGPGPRAKDHPVAMVRTRPAIVTDYGKARVKALCILGMYGGEPLSVKDYNRVEFDAWFAKDAKTPPAKIAAVFFDIARRTGATPEAVGMLRQLGCAVSAKEEKDMVTIKTNHASAAFGARNRRNRRLT